ncbi:MAG: N-6 DNA methylase [Chloroflexi bacterium]|nr:N-6 DNA methylase [Chloroflexota bacterium]
MATSRVSLPRSGPAREALREKGQFWTPGWVAEAMVGYVLADGAGDIFDPAVGQGSFFRAAKKLSKELGRPIALSGSELDANILATALHDELETADIEDVKLADFLQDPPEGQFRAIVANPPYIRHHRVSSDYKGFLKLFAAMTIGRPLDGRAGLHVYFLLQALRHLKEGGKLAFIMPADTCEGVFADYLWGWITINYRLDCVVTFDPHATPFSAVDTNPLIFLLTRKEPRDEFLWARVHRAETPALKTWLCCNFQHISSADISVVRRGLVEGLTTGLSRFPAGDMIDTPRLCSYAQVMRGIAPGAQDFFFLTSHEITDLQLPREFFLRAIGRTRDVVGDTITTSMLDQLDKRGRPTWLLSLDGRTVNEFPEAVQRYLAEGQRSGLPKRPLISQRRPWYKMEVRRTPHFLFAYLGRRNARFIRNLAGVVPLTGFLCVYLLTEEPSFIERVERVLAHPDTIANLSLVAKSYGQGAIKVEPRALERLPIPVHVLEEYGVPARPSAAG